MVSSIINIVEFGGLEKYFNFACTVSGYRAKLFREKITCYIVASA